MSILFVTNDIDRPSHVWMRRMLDGLQADISYLATLAEPPGAYRRKYRWLPLTTDHRKPGLTVRALRKLGLSSSPDPTSYGVEQLRRALDAPRVSVVLVHFLNIGIRFRQAWTATTKPVFIYCHGADVTWDLREYRVSTPAGHPVDYVDALLSLPQSVRFVANSSSTRRRLTDAGIENERITVIHPGVELPPIPDPSAEKSDRGGIKILYLGRLVDCKGPDLLIQAFELACERGLIEMDPRLTIAGDGPLWTTCELLRRRSRFADRIELIGEVTAEEGRRLRSRSDIFTAHNVRGPISGQEEAFGVSFVEAMAQGLPLVATGSGALPELMQDGRQGILVEPNDIEAHADALLKLARDPKARADFGRHGRDTVASRFRIEDQTIALKNLLESAFA